MSAGRKYRQDRGSVAIDLLVGCTALGALAVIFLPHLQRLADRHQRLSELEALRQAAPPAKMPAGIAEAITTAGRTPAPEDAFLATLPFAGFGPVALGPVALGAAAQPGETRAEGHRVQRSVQAEGDIPRHRGRGHPGKRDGEERQPPRQAQPCPAAHRGAFGQADERRQGYPGQLRPLGADVGQRERQPGRRSERIAAPCSHGSPRRARALPIESL